MLKEAITYNEKDIEAFILLAHHYLNTDNLDMCQQLCSHMLKTVSDPSEEVTLVSFKNEKEIYFKENLN